MNESLAKFPLGQVLGTTRALDAVLPNEIKQALARHARGDWGDISPEDHAKNEQSLEEGDRLFSVYHTTLGQKFWIITKADRSLTTILLPEDY